MSKEFLLGMAQQRNNVTLPRVLRNEWGVWLPSERFVLTGVPWGLMRRRRCREMGWKVWRWRSRMRRVGRVGRREAPWKICLAVIRIRIWRR
ncbi:hypothetical protein NA56DRAFT_741651 [Hyaloscypha hepaticicola]|uniref:Uncharacterized protein n=1 Tax=Hyaloscypha hepaticicola TaxID=2082293 RepID=A0A2J6PE16_9HELO|nr:hypothetical protein NA56DRAFT_741651 [Hyaloscypha hepaticicola]